MPDIATALETIQGADDNCLQQHQNAVTEVYQTLGDFLTPHPFVTIIASRGEQLLKDLPEEWKNEKAPLWTSDFPESYSRSARKDAAKLRNRLHQRYEVLRYARWEQENVEHPVLEEMVITTDKKSRKRNQRVAQFSDKTGVKAGKHMMRLGLRVLALERIYAAKAIFAVISVVYREFVNTVKEDDLHKVCRGLRRLKWLDDFVNSKESFVNTILDRFDGEQWYLLSHLTLTLEQNAVSQPQRVHRVQF